MKKWWQHKAAHEPPPEPPDGPRQIGTREEIIGGQRVTVRIFATGRTPARQEMRCGTGAFGTDGHVRRKYRPG